MPTIINTIFHDPALRLNGLDLGPHIHCGGTFSLACNDVIDDETAAYAKLADGRHEHTKVD